MTLAKVLAAVAKALPPERAATIVEPTAQMLANRLATQNNPHVRAGLAEGLATVAKSLRPSGPRPSSSPPPRCSPSSSPRRTPRTHA